MAKYLIITVYRLIIMVAILQYTAKYATLNGFAYTKSVPFLGPLFLLGLIVLFIELKIIRKRKGFSLYFYFSIYSIWSIISMIFIEIKGIDYIIKSGYSSFMEPVFSNLYNKIFSLYEDWYGIKIPLGFLTLWAMFLFHTLVAATYIAKNYGFDLTKKTRKTDIVL